MAFSVEVDQHPPHQRRVERHRGPAGRQRDRDLGPLAELRAGAHELGDELAQVGGGGRHVGEPREGGELLHQPLQRRHLLPHDLPGLAEQPAEARVAAGRGAPAGLQLLEGQLDGRERVLDLVGQPARHVLPARDLLQVDDPVAALAHLLHHHVEAVGERRHLVAAAAGLHPRREVAGGHPPVGLGQPGQPGHGAPGHEVADEDRQQRGQPRPWRRRPAGCCGAPRRGPGPCPAPSRPARGSRPARRRRRPRWRRWRGAGRRPAARPRPAPASSPPPRRASGAARPRRAGGRRRPAARRAGAAAPWPPPPPGRRPGPRAGAAGRGPGSGPARRRAPCGPGRAPGRCRAPRRAARPPAAPARRRRWSRPASWRAAAPGPAGGWPPAAARRPASWRSGSARAAGPAGSAGGGGGRRRGGGGGRRGDHGAASAARVRGAER